MKSKLQQALEEKYILSTFEEFEEQISHAGHMIGWYEGDGRNHVIAILIQEQLTIVYYGTDAGTAARILRAIKRFAFEDGA